MILKNNEGINSMTGTKVTFVGAEVPARTRVNDSTSFLKQRSFEEYFGNLITAGGS